MTKNATSMIDKKKVIMENVNMSTKNIEIESINNIKPHLHESGQKGQNPNLNTNKTRGSYVGASSMMQFMKNGGGNLAGSNAVP